MNVGTLTIFLGVTTSGINKAIRDVNRLERTVAGSAQSMNAAMLAFGRTMTQFVTFPLSIFGGVATKTFSDFEAELAKVTGLVNIATEQTAAWGEEIKALSPAVAKGPKELAEALYFVTTGGIRGAETMDVLAVSAKAAAAGLGETKDVADIVVSAMNAYGKENLSAAHAADILIASVREGKAEASELARSMGIVLPVASKLGAGFDQVGGAMAAMTRTGTKAGTAAMQVRQILNKIIKPAKQSEDAIREMGSSFGELRHIVATEGIIPMLMKVNELTKEYGVEAVAKLFPRIRALVGVLDILGENLGNNIKAQEAITNSTGALNHAFEIVSKTWKFQVNQVIKQGQVLLLEWGEAISRTLIPTIKNLIETLRGWADSFSNLSEAQQKFRVTIGLLAVAMGPLMIIFSILKSSVLPVLVVLYFGLEKAMKAFINGIVGGKRSLSSFIAMSKMHANIVSAQTKATTAQTAATYTQSKAEKVYTGVISYVSKAEASNIAVKKALIWTINAYAGALTTSRIVLYDYIKALSSQLALQTSAIALYKAINREIIIYQSVLYTSTKALQAHNTQLALGMGTMGGSLAVMTKTTTKTSVFSSMIMMLTASLKAAWGVVIKFAKAIGIMVARIGMVAGFVTLIATVGAALYGWIFKTKEVDEVQKNLNDTIAETNKLFRQESSLLNTLVQTATNDLTTKDMRLQAIRRLNDLSPEYLGYLKEENIRTAEGKKLIDDYTASLKRQAIVKASYEKIAQLEAQRIDDLAKGADKQLTFWEKARHLGLAYATGIWKTLGGINEEIKLMGEKGEKSARDFANAIAEIEKIAIRAKYSLDDLSTMYDYLSGTIEDAKENDSEYTRNTLKNIDAQIKKSKEYTTYLDNEISKRLKNDKKYNAAVKSLESATGTARINILSKINQIANEVVGGLISERDAVKEIIKQFEGLSDIGKDILPSLTSKEQWQERQEDVDKFFTDYQHQLKTAENAHKIFGDSYDLLEEKFKIYQKALMDAAGNEDILNDKRIKGIKLQYETAKIAADEMKKMDRQMEAVLDMTERQVEADVKQQETKDDLMSTFAAATALYSAYGIQLENVKNGVGKLTLELDDIKKLLEILNNYKSLLPKEIQEQIEKMIEGFSNLSGKTDIVGFNEDMDNLNARIELLGNNTELLDEKMRLLKEKMRNMLKGPIEDSDDFIEKLKGVSKEIALNQLQIEFFNIKVSALTDIFTSLGESIGKAMAGAEDAFGGLVDAFLGVVKKIGTTLISLGAILLVTGILSGMGASLMLAGTAIVALASFASTVKSQSESSAEERNKQIEGWGMAQGGVVPKGYPNDSYPAMLSSGERVIPPKKLPELEKDNRMHITIEGKVRGQDIHYIMKEIDRKYQGVY
jgi:TP901 family phage tail tape measure protein